MKKSACFIAILTVGLCVVGWGMTNAAEDVKVGEVLPLSGAVAPQGSQLKAGSEIAADEINAEGGIKSMGGAKIKLVFGDSKSTPDGGAAETERLCTLEKVSIILGAFQSGVTFPASEVAERYKTPWMVNVAVKDEITERGFKYVFRDFNKASYDVKEMLSAMELFAVETKKKPKTIALLYEGTDWGRSSAQFAKKYFPEKGYKIILDESYPQNISDFTPQILKIKSAKADLLFIAMYTPDHILFSKTQMEQKLYLPFGIWSVGAGAEDPSFYKAVPPRSVAYMFVQDDWDTAAGKRPWFPAIDKRTKEKLGYGTNAYIAAGYGTIYLVKDALERAASADREKLREAIVATDITEQNCGRIERKAENGQTYCPALVRGIQRIKFDENGQNTFSHGNITQNQKGEKICFWPKEMRPAGVKLAWPIPTWDKRK
ncbi:MAG: ABC transporter substrate-binding protein [Deltaproteobacteria bacterium]|nr:ABC transporter substrate-binding protein [Deltaproteobacteria bacterium]